MTLLQWRVLGISVIFIALSGYSITHQPITIFPTSPTPDEKLEESKIPQKFEVYDNHSATSLKQLQLPNSYQCALVWLRLPKTASTTVIRRFITPLANSARLSIAELGPNTCITHVGGCTEFWKGWSTNTSQWEGIDVEPFAPPYGLPSYNEEVSEGGNNMITNQRCFPDENGNKVRLYCWEFDRNHSTIFYGPHRNRKKKKTKNGKIKTVLSLGGNGTFTTAEFDLYPSLHSHVAIDTSLFGWILPKTPMVFSTFRDPVDRLISSFHYGIQYGGGLPGQVRMCKLPGVENLDGWQHRVILAREAAVSKNLTLYQEAFREYLAKCSHAVDNVYVQFLDPKTKDVENALEYLNKYVIVGMQTDMEETFQRWTKMALWTCRDHPRMATIEQALSNPTNTESHYRESTSLANGTTHELASPTIDELDLDLQQLIRSLTADDQLVFQRAKELYEEQGQWFELRETL